MAVHYIVNAFYKKPFVVTHMYCILYAYLFMFYVKHTNIHVTFIFVVTSAKRLVAKSDSKMTYFVSCGTLKLKSMSQS